MVTAIITLSGILLVTILFLASAIIHIMKIQHELESLDKEQHNQNNDILNLMKRHMTHQEMLLQHIEILKYLVEQDPKMKANKIMFSNTMGEA